MSILAIDPGTTESAWLVLGSAGPGLGPEPWAFAKVPNARLRQILAAEMSREIAAVVIERIEPRYGRQIGMETLVTCEWVGRFAELAAPAVPVSLLRRSAILQHLRVGGNAADAGVRAALIDRFGGEAAIGRKAAPGPLYGVHGDLWAALAVAVTFHDAPELAERLP